ncbi:MAG: hypothetical protein DMF49_01720 [Acidobacteria bacterium]|nr:MAG: hypothetical protein DMF49_01720 [Acidobacteriota bacterium]
MNGARRILVIRLGAVGDVVRTMPALPLLRRHDPRASISWIVEEGPSALLAGHPDLHEVIVLPRRSLAGLLSSPGTVFSGIGLASRFAAGLRARRFDVALDFHGTFKSGLVSLASGALLRYGFLPPGSKEGNRLFNNRHVTLPASPVHRIDRTLAMVRATGAPADEVRVELPIAPRHRRRVEEWLGGWDAAGGSRIVIYPGSSLRQSYKRYPRPYWVEVARQLTSNEGLSVAVAGGPGEEALVKEVADACAGRVRIAPALDLLELAELIRRCDLFIGPDTGPMHIAWAVGTRVVAVFGPTDPALNAPWGEGHQVIYNGAPSSRAEPRWPAPEQLVHAAIAALAMEPRKQSLGTES